MTPQYYFPQNPTEGQIHVVNGRNYTYFSQWNVWCRDGCSFNDDPVDIILLDAGPNTKAISKRTDYADDMLWLVVRAERDKRIQEVEWRYNRYFRQDRLGLPTTDSLVALDTYVQALADITSNESPDTVVWPTLGS